MWAALIAALYTLLLFSFRVGTPGDVRAMVSNLRQSKG
jgi:hypothetical protein